MANPRHRMVIQATRNGILGMRVANPDGGPPPLSKQDRLIRRVVAAHRRGVPVHSIAADLTADTGYIGVDEVRAIVAEHAPKPAQPAAHGTPKGHQMPDPKPITLDQVTVSGTYYGVKVADLNEDSGRMFAFTHDTRRAIAATRRHIRNYHGERVADIDVGQAKHIQVFGECGCSPDLGDDDKGVDCEHLGIPPCRDEFGWLAEICQPDAENAIAVIELEWTC